MSKSWYIFKYRYCNKDTALLLLLAFQSSSLEYTDWCLSRILSNVNMWGDSCIPCKGILLSEFKQWRNWFPLMVKVNLDWILFISIQFAKVVYYVIEPMLYFYQQLTNWYNAINLCKLNNQAVYFLKSLFLKFSYISYILILILKIFLQILK